MANKRNLSFNFKVSDGAKSTVKLIHQDASNELFITYALKNTLALALTV